MVLCSKCGGPDFIELELHESSYSEVSKKDKTVYNRPVKCIRCNFKFVPPSYHYK